MACNTSTVTPDLNLHQHDHPGNSDAASEAHLQALLTAKLAAVPPYHLPAITLSSILTQSPRALHLPHTPLDIQLAFFLRHRAAMDTYYGQPIKDSEKQHIDVTRVIWYYRIDERRQWVRYHDTTRWNLAIFIALLAQDEIDGRTSSTTSKSGAILSPSAYRFIISYLAAVLEYHNAPSTSFTAREAFVAKWKNSNWDIFTAFGGSQKKILKSRMKFLNKEWELELEYVLSKLGENEFEKRVAGFVGCVVPGRRDGDARGADAQGSGPDGHVMETAGGNEILDALKVPFTPKVKADKSQGQSHNPGAELEEDVATVTDLRQAIAAVLRMRPRNILPVLMRVFAEKE
ncbi:hypothetical protein Ptr902_05022 [Pyrenophora tritici-repentis]|nr:hypothetical protein Ptr902_05022 [Pyrenophora tritici-repentis]